MQMIVDGVDLHEGRPGEVAMPDTQIGKDSPGLMPITTVIDQGGMHIYLHAGFDITHVIVD